MSFRVRILMLVALALAALGTPAAAEAHDDKSPSCQRAKSKTIAVTTSARVFRVGREGISDFTVRRLYGCLFSADRPVLLTSAYDDLDYRAASYASVRLAGRFAAWSQIVSELSCGKYQSCPPGYEVAVFRIGIADLKRRKVVLVPGSVAGGALVVTSRGTVAWLQHAANATVEVHARASDGTLRVLDSGAVALSSLSISGATVSWVRDGVARSATLT